MDKKKQSLWYRLWDHKTPEEKKRVRSFVPLVLYTALVMYGIIYLSILNSVNRHKAGVTVKGWWGDTQADIAEMKKRQQMEIDESFKAPRKRVSGGF